MDQNNEIIEVLFYNSRFILTLYGCDRVYSEHYYIEEVLNHNTLVGGIGAGTQEKLTEYNKNLVLKLVKFYVGVFG